METQHQVRVLQNPVKKYPRYRGSIRKKPCRYYYTAFLVLDYFYRLYCKADWDAMRGAKVTIISSLGIAQTDPEQQNLSVIPTFGFTPRTARNVSAPHSKKTLRITTRLFPSSRQTQAMPLTQIFSPFIQCTSGSELSICRLCEKFISEKHFMASKYH